MTTTGESATFTPQPTTRPTANRFTTSSLAGALHELCWVAYSPTHYDPTSNPARWPAADDIRADLKTIRAAGFNGLVTYTAIFQDAAQPDTLLDLPALAEEAGFRGMVVGVWDPADETEVSAAQAAGRHSLVLGYSVGNEGLDERYSLDTLVAAMERLRTATGRPVSTTEQAPDYYENSPLFSISDFIFPNAHPYFSGYRRPIEAVEWTEKVYRTLLSVSGDKPLIFKEVGLPSAGETGLSETNQAEYYRLLRETGVVFVVFEAFDAPWKHLSLAPGRVQQADPEPHWGIFTAERAPKPAAATACPSGRSRPMPGARVSINP